MKLLIDGYNVLKMVYPHAHIDEHERDKFITRMIRYARLSGNTPYIIFDGGDDIRPTLYRQNGIIIVYSGYRESADTVIKNLLEEEQSNEVILISTDRELNKYAENFDIPSMDATVFYGYIRDRLNQHDHKKTTHARQKGQLQKYEHQVSSHELDMLMEEAARNVMYKDQDSNLGTSDRYAQKKNSKIDKRLEKMVKKL